MSDIPLRWALLDLVYTYVYEGFKIVVYTDVPCHLFCRMTKEQPLTHPIPVLRRGTLWRTDVRFCFTVYEDNEQQEPGDTIAHTFDKGDWPICEFRWCYFIGTISGLSTPSDSAIFMFHYTYPEPYPPSNYVLIPSTINSNSINALQQHAMAPNYNDVRTPIQPKYNTYLAVGSGVGNLLIGQHYMHVSWWPYRQWRISRSYVAFDTSTLPKINRFGQCYLKCWAGYGSDPLSYTANYPAQCGIFVSDGSDFDVSTGILFEDYDQAFYHSENWGFISYNDMMSQIIPSFPPGWFRIPLNTFGQFHINQSGYTKFLLRSKQDIDGFEPEHHSYYIPSLYFPGSGLEINYA